MEQALEGKPIEQFEGVDMPTEEERTTPQDTGPPGVTPPDADPAATERLPGAAPDAGALGDDPTNAAPSSASPSSVAPSSASPSTVSPSRGFERRALR
jgi:hypothetical protein